MLSAGLEPAIPVIERSLTYALDRTATDIPYKNIALSKLHVFDKAY
jgi:hypothetical protein